MIMVGTVLQGEGFAVSFSNREVTAWGGLALFRQMLDSMGFREAAARWGKPRAEVEPGLCAAATGRAVHRFHLVRRLPLRAR